MTVTLIPVKPELTDYHNLARAARDEILRRGWMRRELGSDWNNPDNCRVCAVGGMNAAITGNPFTGLLVDQTSFQGGYALFEAVQYVGTATGKIENPYYEAVCTITEIFRAQGQLDDLRAPEERECTSRYVTGFNDNQARRTRVVNLLGKIADGHFDAQLAKLAE